MDLKIIEAQQGPDGLNWGRFAIGRFDHEELKIRSVVEPTTRRGIILSLGWPLTAIWVFDLVTGEGALFTPPGLARADLRKHPILVCPLYGPFLEWLYNFIATTEGGDWWNQLPRIVDLPDAPAALYSHRQPGTMASVNITARHQHEPPWQMTERNSG